MTRPTLAIEDDLRAALALNTLASWIGEAQDTLGRVREAADTDRVLRRPRHARGHAEAQRHQVAGVNRGSSVALAEGAALRAEIDAVLAAPEAEGGNSILEVVPPLLPAITPTSAEPERTGRDLRYAPRPGESHEDALARARTSPFVAAAATIDAVSLRGGIVGFATSANALVQQLEQQAAAVSGGNLGHAESVLSVHAVTLDALFNALALKATSTLQTNADATERYLRMALRTQAQCRATLETLAAIKNPPVVFARQANIATGPQQVNNGVGAPVPPPRTRARSRKKASGPNELLEDGHGQRMDP